MTTEDIERAKKFRTELPFKMVMQDEMDGVPWPFPSLVQARINAFKHKVKVIEIER